MPKRYFKLDDLAETDEERQLLQERYTKNPTLKSVILEQDTETGALRQTSDKEAMSPLKTVGANVLRGLGGAAGGTVLGRLGMALATPAAAAGAAPSGGLSAALPAIGGGVGAVAGAMGGQYLTDKAIEKMAPETADKLALARAAHPWSSTLGEISAGFPFGITNPKAYYDLARLAKLNGAKSALGEFAKMVAKPMGINLGIEGTSQLALEGDIDPGRLALSTVAAPLQMTPTRLGMLGDAAGDKLAGLVKRKAPGARPPIIDRQSLYRKVVEAADAGVNDPKVFEGLAKELGAEGTSPEKLIEVSRAAFNKTQATAEKAAAKELKQESAALPNRLELYKSLLADANKADAAVLEMAKSLEKIPPTDVDLLSRTKQSLVQAEAEASSRRKAALEAMNEYYKNTPKPEIGLSEGVPVDLPPQGLPSELPIALGESTSVTPPPARPRSILEQIQVEGAENLPKPIQEPGFITEAQKRGEQEKIRSVLSEYANDPFIRYSGVDPSAVKRAAEWFAPGLKSVNVKELLARRGRVGDPFSAVAVNHLRFSRPFGIEENKSGEIPTAGLVNKMDSLVPKTEMEYYRKAGLDEFLGSRKGVKAGDLAAWLADKAPKVEVVKIGGAATSDNPLVRENAQLVHELDTKLPNWRRLASNEIPQEFQDLYNRQYQLSEKLKELPVTYSNAQDATIGKYGVEPRPVEKLVDPVEILVRVPLDPKFSDILKPGLYDRGDGTWQLRDNDTRQPFGPIFKSFNEAAKYQDSKYPKWTGGHHGKSGQNAIGFVRGNTEVLPDGKKVFHVFELQSDWAQSLKKDKEHSAQFGGRGMTADDPLLKDWQRTTLKAAIKHAVDTGHDYIALSDAETAMLTEGHDAYGEYYLPATKQNIEALRAEGSNKYDPDLRKLESGEEIKMGYISPEKLAEYKAAGYDIQQRISQEDGMRLHYDQVAPRLLSDLTGVSPERVSFGEHWKAMGGMIEGHEGYYPNADLQTGQIKPRENLIFKNPDGTPKTDISARAYSLEKIKRMADEGLNFSLTGNDKSYYSGMPPHLVSQIARLGLKLPDVFVKFLYEGNNHFGGTKPVLDRLRELGEHGEYLANKTWDIETDSRINFRNAAVEYNNAFDGASKAEVKRVHDYMTDMFDFGTSAIELTPNEQRVYTGVRNGLTRLAEMQLLQGGPLVEDRHMFRERGINPDYVPQMVKRDVYNTLSKKMPGDPEYDRLMADWIAHQQFKLGNTPEEALANFHEFRSSLKTIDPTKMAEYGPVTKAEGIGLPASWRAELPDTLYYHAMRAAKNLSWFKNVQSDPVASKIIGNRLDGKGGLLDPNDPRVANVPDLSDKESVKHWLAEQMLHKTYRPDAMDRWTSLVNSLMIGPKSAIRDFLSTPGHLMELVPGEETGKFLEAAKNLVTSDVRGRAEKAGAISAHRPLEFFLQYDPADSMGRITEAIRGLSGRNLIEGGARQFAFEVGRLVGQARAVKGDYGFFEHLKIPNWREMTPEQLGDAVGNRFVQQSQGQYGAAGLPYYLLNSHQQGIMRGMMNLQRWGVERFNNWYKNAWRPAVDEGKFAPLLRSVLGSLASASVINWIQEELFNQKPPEMTWKEFLRADNKEVAYTLFSKLQTAGFAGALSDIGMAGLKMYHGEAPMPVENSGWSALGGIVARIGQGVGAVGTGKQTVGDMLGTLATTIATDNIQIAKLFKAANRAEAGNREERMYKRQMGLSTPSLPMMNNPFDDTRAMRDADTLAEVEGQIGNVTEYISNTGLVPQFRTPVRTIKRKDGRPNFYSWLSKLQGDASAEKQFAYDRGQEALVEVKRAAVEEARRRVYQSSAP